MHKIIIRAVDGDPLEYVMSDETVDRYGDVIEASGWDLKNFKNNPIALFGHDSSFWIGHWTNVRVVNAQLRGRLQLLDAVSDRLREIHAAVKAGILRAVSVGFRPLEAEPLPGGRGMRYTRSELMECSLVSIGANPNALQVAKALNLSDEAMGLIFGETADKIPILRRETSGEHARTHRINPDGKPIAMSLAQNIQDAEQRLNALRDQLTDHVNKAGNGVMDAADLALMDELNAKITEASATRDALKRSEANLAARSEPASIPGAPTPPTATRRPFAVPAPKVAPKDYVLRGAVIKALAHVEKKPVDVVRLERYGEDEVTKIITDVVTKAATVPATTTTTGWAAELVNTAILDFMESLMPLSVYPGLSARGGRFTFGRNGIVSIPSRSSTPTIAGSFVAQGAPIPVRQGAFQAITLTPKKMAVISTFTREIAEHSTPSIEQLIRNAIQEDTAVAIDTVLLDATAASTTRPAGLRNGVSVTTATSGGGIAALNGDIKNLVAALITSTNGNVRAPVWIMNPLQALAISMTTNTAGDTPYAAEVAAGNLRGYPILQSTSVTAGMLILVDAADFFSATGDEPRFDVSDQATLHMEDTTPLAIGTAGSPNTVAAPVRSLWQTDTIGIRMILDMNWALRRTGVVAWTQSVTW